MRFIINKFIYYYFLIFLILTILCSIFYYSSNVLLENDFLDSASYFSNDEFFWPLPGYNRISSYFGPRVSPTSGASSMHSGIDIPAQEGSFIYAVLSCKVISTSFRGAGGYTIVTESGEYQISYCHVSPNFVVFPGQVVEQGHQIGTVGPKNVYGAPNNPYKDSNGNPTNGATTGPHLHLTIRKNGTLINPLDLF